ncbi:filamentous hemagglutinin N-terminal domain-containing protein [Selenomonas sputigena]|uniref:two-partner secretion domain-containing protein n=1 Tax=Selenomonas sputigena TaxID=69823 RepID=UPI0022349FB4|nr:filamentous hemagglutinin N-terminal domain-containing protein [Selenomonas sputigena]UZE44661.1 filamentous hemagglutinin N-terminal domain-containing protein [Selenomonas sputigena]
MRGMSKKDALACQVSLGLFAGLLGIASTAHGAPSLDDKGVRAGGATVNVGTATTIESHNTNNVIGWKDFSVKNGESVEFDGGAKTNNYLNVVTGKVTSRIDGSITGGKNVYIANTNGVVFGETASVNVGNLYVTTRKLDADAIGTSVKNGTIDLDTPESAGVTGSIINGSAASSAGLAESDIVSLVDGSGSVKATKIVLEGKSVRIMNDAKIDSPDVSAVADQSALEVDAGGMKTVRANKGYVHVGYVSSAPTYGSTGKYKNLTDANMYKLVGSKADLDAIRTTAGGLAGRYMLRNDIDFGGAAHTSIGTNTDPFTGKFDGMFHEIKNMTVASGDATDYAGLFGNASGAEIANVGIRDANLSTLDYGGAVVGKAENSTHIFNVYNEVSSATPAATKEIGGASPHEAGGLVGRLDASSLDNAYNTAPINSQAAGVAGWIQGTSQIYAVYNTGLLKAGTSRAVYKSLGGSSFIKNAYTSQGTQLGIADNTINAYDSYATSTGKAKLVNTNKVTGTAVDDKDAKQASSYGAWDISDEGGANTTWRIFAGQSTPLLTAFMQGTVQAEYSYADFEQSGHAHSGNVSNTYTDIISGTLKTNNGASIPERTYDATYRKITKADGTEVQNVSDVNIVGYTAPAANDPKEIKLDTDHGRRNAGKTAVLYGGQHGYDVAGTNVAIAKRKVVGSWNDLTIEKEYDTTPDATDALKKSLTADSISITGVIDGDNATIGIDPAHPVTANFADANAGYGKSLTIGGTFTLTGADAVNYSNIDAASLTPPASGLKGNIRQKKIVVGLDDTKDYSKTYDGTANVKSTVDPKTTNDVLKLEAKTAGGYAAGDVKLNYTDIKAKYMKDKTSDADDNTSGNAKVDRDIAYKNIKLAAGATGSTANYMLVNKTGDVLYREKAAGEDAYKAAHAADYTSLTNDANKLTNDRYIGAVKTDGGTIWGTGTIEKRKIDASAFTVSGKPKVYDGTDYLVVDSTRKVQGTVDKEAGKALDTGRNVIEADKDKLKFNISAADNKAYYKNSATSATTKDVYNATTNPNGARVLSYTLKASDTTNGETLANYELDLGGGTTRALNTTDDYAVTGAGFIAPREITVDLLKKTGIDKVYDKTTAVTDGTNGTTNNKLFGTNFGYVTGTADDHKLVEGDGAEIKATSAVYKKKASGLEAGDKDVSRTATGDVIEDGKDVEYKIGLTGTNAATNYVLSYTPTGGTATTGSAITMTGTGKITPKKLTLTSTSPVTRGYNGGSDASASLLDGKHTLDGKISGDTVTLNTGTGTTITGTYYKDATKAEKAVNRGTNYTVAYTGISKALTGADSGNYEIDDAFDVLGDITKMVLTKDNLKILLKSKVTKTYDANERAEADGLRKLTVDGTELKPGIGYEIERANSVYYNTLANTGDFKAPNANAQEDDGATLHAGAAAYGVKYTIKLLGEAAGNYELGNWHDGNTTTGKYTVDGDHNHITFERDGVGYIQSRKMYVSLSGNAKNPEMTTKSYDGTTKLILQGATSGDPFLSLGNGGQNNAGFAKKGNLDDASNISTGAYQNRNAGAADDKVLYTPKVTGVPTNYVFYHAPDGGSTYAGQKWDAVHAPLTGKGTITQADLLVKAPTDVRRQYNGDVDVATGQGKLELARPKKHESAPGADDANTNGVLDDVELNHIAEKPDGSDATDKYYRHYNKKDANADDTAANKNKYVTYRRIQLTGADAGNYKLVYKDAAGENADLDKDTMVDSNGNLYYTMKGYGLIEKRKVTGDNFNIGLQTGAVEKTYDGNKWVQGHDGTGFVSGKTASQNPTLWKNLVTKSYVKDGTKEIDIGIASVNEAEYRPTDNTGNAGTRAKDAGASKKVRLNVTFDSADLKNFDLSDLRNAAPNEGAWQADGSYDYYKIMDGKINPKELRVDADAYARKVYDGTSKVKDIENHLHLHDEDVVKEGTDGDDVKLVYGSGKSEGLYKQGGADVSKANIDPFAAAAKGYDVEYTVSFDGKDKGNYTFKHGGTAVADGGKITAKGDIERRMVFADLVNPTLEKYYDGTKDAKRYSSTSNANEDIEDANLTNATAGSAKSVTVLAKSSASFSDDHIKNRDTGLLNADKWSAKGEFAEKDAGARKVTYTLTLSDGTQDNYRIYKKSDFDQLDKGALTLAEFQNKALARDAGTGSAKIDGEGTIQKANLLVKAAEAQKVYNGNTNTDTVTGGILSKLTIDGVYYDTAKAAVQAGGAYEASATLNHTPAHDEYRAKYRDPNVKPKDGKANAVNYSHIQLVDQANNYNLVYQTTEGIKDLEADTTAGYYKLTGAGKITPLTITDVELNPAFNPSSIRKTYDGTADIPDAMDRLRKSGAKVKVKYTEGATPKEWDITEIDGAYSATGKFKDTGTLLAKDAGTNKDVQFTFSVDKDNFIYTGPSIDKPYTGIGTIDPRKVKLTLQDVQKIYDGKTGVKNGYYEGRGSTLKEHANQDVTLRDLIQVEKAERDDKTGALKNERGLLGTDGVALDLANLDAKYLDKNANRSPYSPGAKKDVGYKLHLTGDAKAEDNYEFEVYDNNNTAINQANKTADYNVIGHGDIWYKKVEFDLSQLDKEYDGNANLTEKTLKEKLLLKGAVDGENLSLDDTAIQKIKNGSYGDRKADGSFTQNAHVKRRNGSTGEVVARDVRLQGLDEAMASLSDRDVNGAKNYFYNGYVDESGTYVHPEDMVYGKGKITPKTVKLKKTWVGGFEKPYDGTSTAKLKGADGRYYSFGEASTVGEKDSDETKTIKQAVKRAFYDKLHLSVDLGTGGGAIPLDYKLYGDAEGDEPANMPYYANPTTKERDANVHNDGALTSKKKDIVYRLKEVTSGKDYKDWELDPGDMEARLLDGTYKPDGTTEGTSPLGYTATITPRKITVDEKDTAPLAKIYDGTDTVKDLLRVGEKPFDSTHPDFAYQGILETDKGKVKVEATSTDGRFHDRRTDAADKNATLDAKSWEELAKRKDYNEYNTKNESGKVVHYNLALKSVQHPDSPNEAEKIALGNYEVASTYDASAEIVKRKVKVELDAVAPETLTRDYDGSTKAAVRGLHFSPTNDAHTGLVGTEQALLQGGNTRQGVYDTKDVKRDENGVVRKNAHTITYGNLAMNDDAVSKNYEIDPANLKTDEAHPEYGSFLQDSGTINPKGLKVELLRQDVQKQYDGTHEVKDNAYGTFREGNFRKVLDNEDNNEKNLQEILTKDEKAFHLDANFDSAGASALDANKQSKADKQVTYDISWSNGNYKLLDKDGNDLTQTKVDKSGVSFTATVRTQPQSGTIYRRRLQVTASDAWKVYNGTTGVNNAWNNLNFANVDEHGNGTGEGAFASESEEQRAKNSLRASYDDAEATEADTPAGALKRHNVNYRFEGADDVMGNYEFVNGTPAGGYSVDGAGFIKRRTLDVLPDWQATYAGKGGVNYTGRIADGSAQANEGSLLTPAVADDLQRFNSGVFTYGPMSGSADYSQPNWQEIQGWYTKDGVRTLARGEYERNYTLNLVPSRLFVAPRTDGVDRTLRPDGQVYAHASYDEKDTFGAHRGPDASLTYTGAGVNYGGTKLQQGTSANVGDAGIRQQGTGTNIGGSAGVGGTAGMNGKVQGATGAVNEAARAAGAQSGAAVKPQGTTGGNAALAGGTAGSGGYYSPSAQPGASVKPQGAQSGAAVKPQGTTGGNAALAGGTAGQGGYYSPSAQPGASVKPQGAQSGVAAKPQGAASAAGSASRVGAGSVVDRGLAAAAGVSVGSSSDARTGASGSLRNSGSSSGAGSYVDGSSRAADRGLANALGKGVGSAGYYNGKGYSHTDDDEEEEIKKKTKASA